MVCRAGLFRWLAVALLGLGNAVSAAPASVCPAGQHHVCVLVCFCAPGSQADTGPIFDRVGQMAAGGLQSWLVRSRNVAVASGVQEMPLHMRAYLEPYYDFQVLNAVRYKVGGEEELNAANAVLQNPDVQAVTLVDVIVFRHEADALGNVALWAHELKHVEQYQQWGVAEFAARYTRDFNAVEAPAYAIQLKVAKALQLPLAQPRQ